VIDARAADVVATALRATRVGGEVFSDACGITFMFWTGGGFFLATFFAVVVAFAGAFFAAAFFAGSFFAAVFFAAISASSHWLEISDQIDHDVDTSW